MLPVHVSGLPQACQSGAAGEQRSGLPRLRAFQRARVSDGFSIGFGDPEGPGTLLLGIRA